MLTIRVKPMKIAVPISRGDGLGRAMSTAGNKNKAAWAKAMTAMAVLALLLDRPARLLPEG
jgi:hypothetical protein